MSSEVTIGSGRSMANSPVLWLPEGMDWKQRWEELARQRPDILSNTYPGELPEISPAQRTDLWRMGLLTDVAAMSSLKSASNRWNEKMDSVAFYAQTMFEIIAPIVVTVTTHELFNMNIIVPLSALFATGFIVDAIRRLSAYLKRRDYLLNLVKQLEKVSPLERFLNSLHQAHEANASLSPELDALLFLRKRGSVNWGGLSGLSIKDCMALSSLADSTKEVVGGLRDGALLTLGGDSSELLNRIAMLAYGKDLGEIADDLSEPQRLSL